MRQGPDVVAIDDQTSYLDAFILTLSMAPSFNVVGRASDLPSGVDKVLNTKPDLVVTDYCLPDGATGTELAAELRQKRFTSPILILTGFLAPKVSRQAAELANVQVVSKSMPMKDILAVMSSMAASDGPIDITDSVLDLTDSATGVSWKSLTKSELDVLERLSTGKTPAEIAEDIGLSLHTVRARIKAIYKKLEVSSQAEALAVAMRDDLVVPAH